MSGFTTLATSALVLLGLVVGCATSTDMSRVTGTVTYRERIAMPPGAIVELTLEDVSRMDAPAEVLGHVTIEDPGDVPVEFAIPYDPADLDERGSYSVRARILVDGRPRWVSDTANPVLTWANDERVDVVVRLARPAGERPTETMSELAGTSWRLVEFQGGDDTLLVPDDGGKYTIAFGTDGRVSVRVDCNRGSGTWSSEGPNHLTFGPLALTRAMCPPGSLHDRLVRDWEYVRSYVLEEDHLFLSLMADAGIYEYEPTPAGTD